MVLNVTVPKDDIATKVKEAHAAKLKPLGIIAVSATSNRFRIELLNAGKSKIRRRCRQTLVLRSIALCSGSSQPGDVSHGAEVVIDVAEGTEAPAILVLGKDCFNVVKCKCERSL